MGVHDERNGADIAVLPLPFGRVGVTRLALTEFRNYRAARLDLAAGPVVLTGPNIGDLLNAKHVTWGWFQGGFAPSTTNSGGAVCGSELWCVANRARSGLYRAMICRIRCEASGPSRS